MKDDTLAQFCDIVRSLLREIREIKTDTGYSTDQILLAMIATACLGSWQSKN